MSIADKILRAKEDYDRVFEAGKKSEYDAFWDIFQSNGQLTSYTYAFAYGKFNDETFRPKYDIRPTNAERMFAYNNNVGVGTNASYCITDLSTCLSKAGVVLDTSKCENMNNVFYMGKGFTILPEISFESCTKLDATFYGCTELRTIEKMILREDGTNTFTNETWNLPFGQCVNLENITIEGVIGDSISFWQSPLSKASVENIFSVLSANASGKKLTLSSGSKGEFTADEWNALVATRTNWTISIV